MKKLVWPQSFINQVICGDSLEILKKIPDHSIDLCLTSPPYWGLRDYGTGPDQLGLESTPELYIDHLIEIFNEVKRMLKKEGTFWLNIGDTYSATRWSDTPSSTGISKSHSDVVLQKETNLPNKCLCMIPEHLAWSLIQNGWILRNKIPWIKPNCMPSSVKDRYTNKYEFVYFFVKSRKYYFDLDSVREPHSFNRWSMSNVIKSAAAKQAAPGQTKHSWQRKGHAGYYDEKGNLIVHPKGKNPGDIWTIPTRPCPVTGLHFASFPDKLCERAIMPGSPEQVCKKCGKARERIVEKYDTGKTQKVPDHWDTDKGGHKSIHRKGGSKGKAGIPVMANKTIGWTSCDCKAGFEGGIVLDPFAGIGTSGKVAKELGRRFIMIDIKKEYCEAAEKEIKKVGFQMRLKENE